MNSMKVGRFLSLPVLGVLSVMLFLYYTTIFIFLDDWVGFRTSPGTLNSFFFTLFASLALFSFSICVLTDPGHVPPSFYPDVESTNSKDNAEQKKCDKCFGYKPPRTHHCRVCRKCVLKMVGQLLCLSIVNVSLSLLFCEFDPGSSLLVD
ncbi:putative protein S-acyltransferase 15, variant 3 [Lathyrus oleraceus]|uniref:S-acyltransferase n=1 Tax=Pisum sativum TaxID=3888 RepID=A0A9D5ABQ0_PEA|nr:putative protein S-acyltransferase 15, variant 3 [Pisum sativum]